MVVILQDNLDKLPLKLLYAISL